MTRRRGGVLEVLDAAALRQWCALSLEALTAHREQIDDLNVYPVPDGDTGTNLQLTMASVKQALDEAGSDLADTVKALVTGSLMGARGNSGVILSQLLRGLGEALAGAERMGPHELKAALEASARSAYAAVATPVEGTVLTVAREAAEGARGLDLAAVVRSARQAGAESLARTTELLPQLKAAGVVDAGGRGWCLMLEALERVVTGEATAGPPPPVVSRDRGALVAARESGSADYQYEVQYLLRDADDARVDSLKEQLAALGDSLVVVGGNGLHTVHVHVNDVGAAIEAGIEAGRPFRIEVTRFSDQVAQEGPAGSSTLPAAPATQAAGETTAPAHRAVVAVTTGPGIAALVREHGGHPVDATQHRPSTRDLLEAARASAADEVVVLPNDPNVRAVADAAAGQAVHEGRRIVVVPTSSVVQGLAALAVADSDQDLDQATEVMAAAAARTRWAEVTTASRQADTDAGACQAGDVLGLAEGRIVTVGSDVEQVCRTLLDQLLGGGAGELVTVLLGRDAPPGVGESLASYARGLRPGVEVLVLDGGQPHYPVLLGVE